LPRKTRQARGSLRYELYGVLLLALSLFGYVSFLSPGNVGALGQAFQWLLQTAFGRASLAVPALIGAVGASFIFSRRLPAFSPRATGVLLLFSVLAVALHLYLPAGTEFENGRQGLGGGLFGALLSRGLWRIVGPSGRYVVLIAAGVVGASLVGNLSLVRLARWVKRFLAAIWRGAREALANTCSLFLARGDEASGEQEEDAPPVHVAPRFEEVTAREVTPPSPARGEAPTGAEGRTPVSRESPGRPAGPEPGVAFQQVTMDSQLLYQLPPLSLLRKGVKLRAVKGGRDVPGKVRILEETLESFGVKARVTEVNVGPTITRFELQPAPGVKVSKIVSLADDIALSLAATDVRIEAPIPGKSAVGIEVPNEEVTPVYLREVLESPEFDDSPSKLTVALGKDITGRPIVNTLEKMLHLLIAGATGSGKSACLNAIICSILFKARPDEVKLLMIDPKVVEFTNYNGIPHLLAPVITDPRKAAGALKWVLREMENRYELFASLGVRDISKYHQLRGEMGPDAPSPLPLVVVIIDELADLMMISAVEVEDAICRLAQMARAAGIHLVVATQRPSVDVITGLIKANIPSRIAFAVSSQVDSRTILDVGGAEKLLGRGDMLFFPVGATKPVRAQGAFISEKEVEELVGYVRRQTRPRFEAGLLELKEEGREGERPEDDSLFPQAVRVIVESGQASVSMLQRRLRVGYTRAARLIDAMEERGYVGRYEGTKPREVLITMEDYRRLFGP